MDCDAVGTIGNIIIIVCAATWLTVCITGYIKAKKQREDLDNIIRDLEAQWNITKGDK